MTRARDLAAFVSNADGDIKFDTDTLFIDSSANKVGIGTTSPDELLELSAVNDAAIKITSTNAGAAADDVFGLIKFESGDTSGTTPHIAGQISSIATDNFGRGRLAFSTGRTGDFAERMTIQSGGNVGIGTSSPKLNANGGQFLTLQGTGANAWLELASTSQTDNLGGAITFNNTNVSGTDKRVAQISSLRSGADNVAHLSFATNNGSGNTERMRILADGGLTFNGDTAAANALDDYEQGEHEVTLVPSGSGTISVSGSNNDISYTKIGNRVHVSGQILATSSSSPVGYIKMSLPFPIKNSGTANTQKRVTGRVNIRHTSLSTNQYTLLGVETESLIRIYRADGTDVLSTSANQFASMPGTGISVIVNFTYPTDS